MHSSQIGETSIRIFNEPERQARARPLTRESSRRRFVRVLYLSGRRVPVVEVLFVRVHPNLRRPNGILEEVWSRVGSLFRKNVAHVRAGMNLQAAPALPHLWNDKHRRKKTARFTKV